MEQLMAPGYFSGISGLQLPIPKYRFPAPFENASRLTYYASFCSSIEINSSFYRVPLPATVAKWADSVPEDFRFTFKLWKEVTHSKGFDFKEEDLVRFFASIDAVGRKRGALLIQFPPGITVKFSGQLHKLLAFIQSLNTQKWDLSVEFRHKSWYDEVTYDLLNAFHAGLVIQDMPGSSTPAIDHQSDFRYLRFHGPAGDYRGGYSDDFLNEYATYIGDWLMEGKRVYVYFNNTLGDAWHNLQTLNGYVSEEWNNK